MDADRAISLAMTFWELGIASEDDIIAWADARIRDSEQPDMRLIDLSTLGPKHCDKLPWADFPVDCPPLPLPVLFSALASTLDLTDDEALLAFAKRVFLECLGYDDTDADPIKRFGYQVDHLLCDMQSPQSAVAYIREQLPGLLQQYSDLWPYRLDEIPIDA